MIPRSINNWKERRAEKRRTEATHIATSSAPKPEQELQQPTTLNERDLQDMIDMCTTPRQEIMIREQFKEINNGRVVPHYDQLEQLAEIFSTKDSIDMVNEILNRDTDFLSNEGTIFMEYIFNGGFHTDNGYQPLSYAYVERALAIRPPRIVL